MCFMQNIRQQRRRSVFFGVEFRVELLYLHQFFITIFTRFNLNIIYKNYPGEKKNGKLKNALHNFYAILLCFV
jgi:hypothetical protein